MFNEIVVGLLSHAMSFVDVVKFVHVIDAETGEILYKVSPAVFAGILAEVKRNEWAYTHVR